MRTSELSFLSGAEKITLLAYQTTRSRSVILSEVVGRVAAAALFSLAAALDMITHSLLVLPTFIYSIGKSIYMSKADFSLPWQHIQRVQNAVSPLLLGSLFGLIYPYAGLVMSEPTDKHIAVGILSSHTRQSFETPCSPIHSLSIIEDIAENNRFVIKDGVKKEIFSPEHLNCIHGAKKFEESLESLQAQEWIHKITNVTLAVMAKITFGIRSSNLDETSKETILRFSGVLIPFLTAVDITITFIAQTFFLTTGIIRLVSGRGPIYTEVTVNPLMHVSFLIQNILKSVGNMFGTLVWFVSPMTGFKVSLLPATAFFKLQMLFLILQIRIKMHFANNGSKFVIPIVYGLEESSVLSVPTHSMHKTYLIVEKRNKAFNLYWINRPDITLKQGLGKESALKQIRHMLDERFPYMDTEKMLNFPVVCKKPEFSNAKEYAQIADQGNSTNCPATNLFGMLEALDRINGQNEEVIQLRNSVVRSALMKKYGFYKNGFFPFSHDLSLSGIWEECKKYPEAPI